MSVKIEGIDEFIAKLDKAAEKIPKARNKFLKRSAESLIKYTKDLTPVDIGGLRNSWQRTRPYGGSIKVFNNAEYAAHVEYGHRVKNRKGEWARDKNGRIKFVKGAYMLHQGVDELRDDFEEGAQEIMGDILK